MNIDNLVEFRKKLGLTQKEMAAVIGVSRSSYTCYERTIRIIPIEKLNIISNKYHESLHFLAGETKSNNIEFVEKEISYEEIGKILKQERENANMTKTKLGEELNVHRTTIGKYEKGKALDILVLIQYSEFFNKSIDYLCGKADK